MEKYKFLIPKKLHSDMFSIVITYSCETVWVKVLLPKGWMVAVRNYSANTIMDKKQIEREGVRLRIINFQG